MKYAEVEERILGGTTARRGDVVITRGEGSWVFDEKGKKYLDLGSAQGVAMLGHCHPRGRGHQPPGRDAHSVSELSL